MKLHFTAFLFLLIFLQMNGLSQCSPILDENSVISNNYRESTISSLENLVFDLGEYNPYYDGDGMSSLFDLGFARGIWAGGYDPSGNLKLAASGYSQGGADYIPGPLWRDFQDSEGLCAFYKRVWTITNYELATLEDNYISGQLDIQNIPLDILEWPAKGNPHIGIYAPDYDMAPFYDNDQDGIYDPLMGDYPLALEENADFFPSQFRFYVMNDMTAHSESGGESLGMEFHILDYLVNNCEQITESETSIFTRLKYINKGQEDLRNFIIGIWDDSDIGCYRNDFVGCLPSLNANFIYNKDGQDPEVCDGGLNGVPENLGAVGSLVFLNRNLESFHHIFHAGTGDPSAVQTDPIISEEFYSYLDGKWLDGEPMTLGGTGYNPGSTNFTSHMFPDLPTVSSGWSMQSEDFSVRDTRTISVFGSDLMLTPGQSGSVDFVDHIMVDEEKTGLDIFDDYEQRINTLKDEYRTMTEGGFECGVLPDLLSSTIENLKNADNFTVSPNPARDYLDINLQEFKSGELMIQSMKGDLLSLHKFLDRDQLSIPVDDLEPGLYILSMTVDDKTTSVRFVKM